MESDVMDVEGSLHPKPRESDVMGVKDFLHVRVM